MGIVSDIVSVSDTIMEGAARSTFISLVESAGSITGYLAVLAVVLIGINMIVQFRPMDWGQTFSLIIRLSMIMLFAWNWNNFWEWASAIIKLGESLASLIIKNAGVGSGSVTGSFAESFDQMLDHQAQLANSISDKMAWYNGAMLNGISVLLIGAAAALAAIMLMFTKIMIAFYLGIAPIMITLSLFNTTKEYFEKWFASAVSYAFYPVVIGSIFGAIITVADHMRNELGSNPDSVGQFIPFVALMLITIAGVATIPMIVSSITGNVHLANAVRTVAGAAAGAGMMMGAARMTTRAAINDTSTLGKAAASAAKPQTYVNAAARVNNMAQRARSFAARR